MATPAVPAVVVSLNDPRLFPTEEDRERERLEAREKPPVAPSRPVLYTSVRDDPSVNHGCKGKCDYADCECLYHAGKGGDCARCGHANLYHRVKIRRVDLEAKLAADALKRMKHRRHIPTQKEIEEQKEQEVNKPPEPVNNYPCDVPDCECKKMLQPNGWDPVSLLPKLCRNCKHAEMYHVKRKKDDKRNGRSASGARGGTKGKAAGASSSRAASATSSARNSARGTGRSGAASAKGKKSNSKK